MPESAAIVRRFDDPDEHRDFPLGGFDLVAIGGMSIGRAEYEPGAGRSTSARHSASRSARCRTSASSCRDGTGSR
jgi:hypothetical protein